MVSACESAADPVGIEVAGVGTLYPGGRVTCQTVERCGDILDEVGAWLGEWASDRSSWSVELHEPRTLEAGTITRSGGGTWIAVVTFEDGTQTAVMVGCGEGIMATCASADAFGRVHRSEIREK